MVNPRHQTPQGQSFAKPAIPFVEYSIRECKHDRKESDGNMFNPIFKETVQGRKHPGSCPFAETELLSYRKPKRVVQNENNCHQNPDDCHNYYDENNDEVVLYQGNSERSTQPHSTIEQGTVIIITDTTSYYSMAANWWVYLGCLAHIEIYSSSLIISLAE